MRARWFSARALKLHAAALFVIAACVALGWWQLTRAIGGNGLSWVYTFEWPFFAAYAAYMWWKLLHEPLSETRAAEIVAASRRRRAEHERAAALEAATVDRVAEIGYDPYDESDPELAAYNRYLASLHRGETARPRAARPAGALGLRREAGP